MTNMLIHKNREIGKKALSDYMLFWALFKIAYTVAIVFVVVIIVQSAIGGINSQSRSLDAKTITNSLMASKLFMEYDDDIDRIYIAHLDISKWENEDSRKKLQNELKKYVDTGDVDYIAMRIMFNRNKIYLNKALYSEWRKYIYGGLDHDSGPGGYTMTEISYPITYSDDYKDSEIAFEVIIPNG